MTKGNSLYAKLTRDLMPQYSKRIISDDETIQMLLSMLYQHTGIAYVQESGVGVRAKAYSEGYEVGRVETRRAYEGKRYTEAEMDKHGQYKYQEGYEEGKRVQEAVKRSITPLFPTEAAVTVVYDNGYRDGVEEGKRQYDWLRKQAEAKYKDLKVKYDKLEQEIKAIERCADTAYDKGYLKGCQEAEEKCAAQRQLRYQQGFEEGRKVEHDHAFSLGENAGYERRKKHVQVSEEHFYAKGHNEGYQKGKAEGVAIGIKVKDEALNEYRKDGHNEGYLKGIEEGTKGKEKFATDRAEEAYSKGYRIGLGNGIKQGKKEVVDFINNMKVSQ